MISLHDKLSEIERDISPWPQTHNYLLLLKMLRRAVEGLGIIREELSTSGVPQELRDTLESLQQLANGKEE